MVKMWSQNVHLKWKDEIIDAKERKVFEALENPRWDFRTIEGLSRSTEFSQEDIMIVLGRYHDFIQIVPVPDRKGRRLYKLKGRSTKRLEVLNTLRVFISKSIS